MLDKYVQKDELGKLKIFLPSTTQSHGLPSSFKLSIVTQFYPPDFAATGQLIEELAMNLGQLGIQVKVFTGQPGYAFQKESAPSLERLEKVLVRRSRASRLWDARIRGKAINGCLFFLRACLHFMKAKNRGDLLLLTTAPPFLPLLGYFTKLIFGLPYVCLEYDLYPDVAVGLKVVSSNHRLVKFWNWLNRKIWQQAERIIVLSSTMKDRIVAHCPEVSDKIAVIHNWADPTKIVPIAKQDNWFARQHDLVNKFSVLYSGNLGRCHEMDTILEAARQLKYEAVQFIFIGGGAKLQNCIERVKKLGLDNCRFLPYQDKKDLPYSLTACDLSLVSISSGMEGLVAPSKLYGVLAAGRPVAAICESHSYLCQLLAQGHCGATFDNGDGTSLAMFIRRLKNEPELAKQMGNAGRHYLLFNFTPEIIAKQYLNVLRQALLATKKKLIHSEHNSSEVVTEDI